MLASLANSGYNPSAMYRPDPFSSPPQSKRSRLFELCILISLLLHLGIAALLNTDRALTTERVAEKEKPTIVRLVDKPREWELDQPPATEKEEPPIEPARLAERNQRVDKEQAPKGEDSRDQTAIAASPPKPAKPATSKTSPAARQQSPAPASKPKSVAQQENKPISTKRAEAPDGQLPRPTEKQIESKPAELPTLAQLTQLTPATIARSKSEGQKERIKEREGVEAGDTVWLNLEKGLLISFFRRFRNQIEGVWNYPLEAARNEIEGILLLKITIDREGEMLDVELLKTSGSDLLDYEAIEAVYRAAPFGPLPSHYQHPELKIFAHFRYILTGKYIYGR